MIVYWHRQHQLELLKWHLRDLNIVFKASGPCPANITKSSPSFRCFHLSTLLSSPNSFSSHPEPPLLFKLLPEWVVDDMADFLLFGLQFLPQVDAEDKVSNRAPSRLRISAKTQNFWVFSFYIADFWQSFWVIWENGSLIKFEAENECFCTWKVEKPQCTTSTP